MIEVDPVKRLTLNQILRHPWVLAGSKQDDVELELPMTQVVQTSVIPVAELIDPDVLSTMNSLQCFKDKNKLIEALLSPKHNTEKVIYFLLLDRKLRNPSHDDDEAIIKSKSCDMVDPPKKRVDSKHLNGSPNQLILGRLSEGSPVASRRALAISHVRKNSLQSSKSPSVSPLPSPASSPRLSPRVTANDSPLPTPPGSPSVQSIPWKSRLHTIKNSFLGSPRFHRRKYQVPTSEDIAGTPDSSPELTKKSWFGSLMGMDRDEQVFVMIKDKPLSQIKADLIHAFLCTTDLSHNVLSPMSFRVEYRRSGSAAVFSRNVKFQVDIAPVHGEGSGKKVHCVNFTLLSGPHRRFRRICELLQSMLLSRRGSTTGRRISVEFCSDSSSSSYSSMEHVSPPTSAESAADLDLLKSIRNVFDRERRGSTRSTCSSRHEHSSPILVINGNTSADDVTKVKDGLM